MLFLPEIILGLFTSLSFIFGFILYKAASEEIDNFASRFNNKKFTILLPKIALPIAGLFGLMLAISTKLAMEKTMAILVFASGVIFGSLALRTKEKSILMKHMVEVIAFFLIFYFFILSFLNFG